MSSFNDLETTLLGFRPRTPSPRVRRQLFEAPTEPRRPRGRLNPAPGIWAAPLTATALLMLGLATAWPPSNTVAGGLNFATLPPGWEPAAAPPIERNALPTPSFRSTTRGGLTSSFGSLLLRQTNVFAR